MGRNNLMIDELKSISIPALLPVLLLLLALSTMFLFGNDRGHFYRDGFHAYVSSQSMPLAANLSPDHHFLMFFRQTLDADGIPSYNPYNRFPIGTYALIKLAILPFEHDLEKQIYAARLLMLLFFTSAVVLAYLSLCRLIANPWIALTATLLAFSSFYCLYFNDMISTEVTSFFGVMLTFHGMVLFLQEGRFQQLLVKTCVALLLGWHVFALLLPFIVFGLVRGYPRAFSRMGEGGGGGTLILLAAFQSLSDTRLRGFDLRHVYPVLQFRQ